LKDTECELCQGEGGELVLANEFLRVVLVNEPNFPGFTRVIWNEHVREMSELDRSARNRLMETVCAVESALREVMQPLKINLASLGNMTPHLHWHVIPRFADDTHYSNPVWGQVRRSAPAEAIAERRNKTAALRARIAERVARVQS
jgi:diadenosine tetraphosphate (Ap4A) HIT family hydrolase